MYSIRNIARSSIPRFSISRRFNSTLTFIEAESDKITSASLSALEASKQIGNPITAILLGSNSESLAKNLSKTDLVNKILICKNENLDNYLPEQVTPIFEKILKDDKNDFKNLIVPASSVGKNFLPRLGALLDVQPVSDIIKVIDPKTFIRPVYAGNAWSTVKSKDEIVLTSVRSSSFPQAVIDESGSAVDSKIEEIEYVEPTVKSTFVGNELIKSERPDLGSAKIVVSGGRGLKNKEEFEKLLFPLSEKLNAAIGASRAAVDSGFCDNSLQVGQTGKVVAPDLYIAVGISGAIQHLAGMKDSKVIVAINKDEESPIFSIADVSLVGDLFEVVPELTSKLWFKDNNFQAEL